MTEVLFTNDGDIRTVTCRGHADSPELCAAVSALCFTLAGYLHNVPCWISVEKLEPGNVELEFVGRHVSARSAFDMAAVGFMQLEKSYPGRIKTTVRIIHRYAGDTFTEIKRGF